MNEKIKVLDVPISNYTAKEAMQKVMKYMHTEQLSIIELVTLDTLVQLFDKEEQKQYFEEFEITAAADKALLEAAGITDSRYLKEVQNLLFVKMAMRFLHKNRYKVFLLAEDEETLKRLKDYVAGEYGGIVIAETATMEEHGKSDDMIVNRVNGAEADCIIATLPSPLQEEFVLRNRLLLNARIWFGFGMEVWESQAHISKKQWLKSFFTQHIVKKKIEKEQKRNQGL